MYVHTSSYTVFIVWTRQDDTKACALYTERCENQTENIYSTMAQRWSGVTPSSHRNFAKFLRTLFAEGGRLWRHINDRTTRDFNNLEDELLRSLVFDHKEGRQPWKQWAGRFYDRTPAELRSRARTQEGFTLMIVIESNESPQSCRLEADSFSGGLNTTYISHTRSFVNVRK